MMTTDTRPSASPTVVGRLTAGEAVLVLPAQGEVKVLNEVGARIWSLVDGSRTVGQIAAAIGAEYDVEPGQAETDVLEFLTELERKGIIAVAAGR